MSALSENELADIRSDFTTTLYKDYATFYRAAAAGVGDMGEASTGPDTVVSSNILCRIGSPRQRAGESDTAGQVKAKTSVDIWIPFDADRPEEADYAIITSQNNRRIEISGSEWVTDSLGIKVMGWEE